MHTNISNEQEGKHTVYGYPLSELMQNTSFSEVLFLLYTGVVPDAGKKRLLDSMLVAAIEHGIDAPSLYAPRISVASGNPVHVGIAAGILAIGSVHGGAGEAAARLLLKPSTPKEIVAWALSTNAKLPGFGHKVYTTEDPRATILFKKAQEAQLPLDAFEKAYAIEKELAEQKGKKLPLNVDGAFAAATISLGLPPQAATALFVVARVAGMGAHAIEEAQSTKTYYRLSDLSQ